jgi:DNA-binding beta-propeller fold protein YncE
MLPLRIRLLLLLVLALPPAVPARAAGGTYEIWITNQTQDRVEIYAAGDYRLLATVAVDADGVAASSKPHMIMFSPNRRFAYVANVGAPRDTNNVTVLDTRTRQVVGVYPAGLQAHAAVPSPDGKRVWVTNIGDNTLTEYLVGPRGQLTLGRTLPAHGVRPICLAFTADSRYAYLTNGGNTLALGSVVVFDVMTGEAILNAPIGREGCGTVRSSQPHRLYVSAGYHPANPPSLNDEWWVFDTRTHTVAAQGRGPGLDMHGLSENVNGQQMWMVSRRTNQVNVFNTRTYTLLASYDAGDKPDLLAFSPDGSLVFISRRGTAVTGDPHALTGQDGGFVVMRASDGAILSAVSTGADDVHGLNVLAK